MNVLMIDELPIYIHGMKTELKRVMPECTVFYKELRRRTHRFDVHFR